jgi:hypothetical protein
MKQYTVKELANNPPLLDSVIKQHRLKMLENGYTEEDLEILDKGLECLAYSIVVEHFRKYYSD